MIFTLSGVETINKGAELMIYAILQEIERRFPKSTVYFDVGSIPQGFNYIHTNLTIKEKPIERLRRIRKKYHFDGICRRFHINLNEDFYEDIYAVHGNNYFLDASGFHFSDQWQWPEDRIRRKKKLWQSNKKQGSKIIFLPQAFGPFTQDYSIRHVGNMAKFADIIMARERISYDYLHHSGVVDMNKVRLFCDFTSLVHGVFPSQYENLRNAVCIIPNCRMIDKGTVTFEDYIKFITEIVNESRKLGHIVYLLNHEGKGDEDLAIKCKNAIGNNIEVVTGLNSLQVKGLISTSYLVITSRFHGVASALNSGVPCLATSWSHKYLELFNDYNQNDCLLPLNDVTASCQKVGSYLNKDVNNKIRKDLESVVPHIQQKTMEMWNFVWNC